MIKNDKPLGSIAPSAPASDEPVGKKKARGRPAAEANRVAESLARSSFDKTAARTRGAHTDPATIGNPPAGQPGLMKDWKKDKVSYQAVEGSLKLGSLTYDDLTQGDSGDCYFLSSAVAIAHDDPDALKKLFTDNADGTTTVHFFEKGRDGAMKPVDITVDHTLPVGKDGLEYAQGRDKTQLWPAILENAYAQWKGGYENIGEGGEPRDALLAMTGKTSTYTDEISKVDPDALWKTMTQATAQKRPMVTGTFDQKDQPVDYQKEDLVEGHDYTLLRAYESDGQRLVDVRNPWGSDQWKGDLHPHDQDGNFTMKYEDYLKRFEDFTVLDQPVASPA